MKLPLWLHRYACFVAGSVLFLICLGGVVTSKNAGMTVPDWPTSYGYNMFLFPWERMTGGIFLEHSHRLVASGVGLLTLFLTIILWQRDSRSWMRWLGVVALITVCLQGVLGGLRVTLYKDEIGIFHALLAQAFFALLGFISLATSRWWFASASQPQSSLAPPKFSHYVGCIVVLLFVQHALGATMRHEHIGLAIPDFPRAYGQWWPTLDAATLTQINADRLAQGEVPTTVFQIVIHLLHRLGAIVVSLAIFACAWLARPQAPLVKKLAFTWVGLVLLQVCLGIWTIWSNKAADIATAHVAVGALLLLTGTLLLAISARLERCSRHPKLPLNEVSPDFVLQA
jgi:heme a synthase